MRAAILLPCVCVLTVTAPGRGQDSNPYLVGQPAPDFTLPDIAGRDASLAQFKGKPVLISFFGYGCAPCRVEAEHLSRLQKTYQDDGLVVLGIHAWDEPKADVVGLAQRSQWSHRVLLHGSEVARDDFLLGPVPTTFWIDRKGKIVHQTFGFSEKDVEDMETWTRKIVGREPQPVAASAANKSKPAKSSKAKSSKAKSSKAKTAPAPKKSKRR